MSGKKERIIVSWDEAQAIRFEEVPVPPVLAGLAVRPEHLTYHHAAIYYADHAEWYEHLHKLLTKLALSVMERYQLRQVLTTLTLGWDTALAEAALELHVPFTATLPFANFYAHWDTVHKQRFLRLRNKADEVVMVSQGKYAPWKLSKANQYKIEQSDLLLVLWDGLEPHTKRDLRLAERQGKEMVHLWETWKSKKLI
jgi:uncharacterized phage-like protein YoqJ